MSQVFLISSESKNCYNVSSQKGDDMWTLIEDLGHADYYGRNRKKGIYQCSVCGFNYEKFKVEVDRTTMCGTCGKKNRTTHGMTKTKQFKVWSSMINRTTNPNYIDYEFYKDKKPNKRWFKFENFWEDMKDGYKDGLTLDRIDNDKPYSKENCRWTTRLVQSRNQRRLKSTNKTGYKGVVKRKNRYEASIRNGGKPIYLGLYKTKIDAAKAYDKYVIDNNLEHTTNGVYDGSI